MERPLLLDTDVLVDFLRGHKQAVAFVTKNADRIVLSAIVLAELSSGVKGAAEDAALGDLVGLFRVLGVTPQVAREVGSSGGISEHRTASAWPIHCSLPRQRLRGPNWQGAPRDTTR